jgi:peptide/nickel transport system permease protein
MAIKPVVADTGLELVGVAAVGPARAGFWTTLRRFCRKKPLGAAGGALMLVMALTALLAEPLSTHDPIATDAANTLAPPSAEHWLGSDHLGRDIHSRIVHGARVSLVVGVFSTLLGSVFGGIIGLLSAYFGGKTDLISQRLLDILQGLPLLVLALVMAASLGPSIPNVILAISIPITSLSVRSRPIRTSI